MKLPAIAAVNIREHCNRCLGKFRTWREHHHVRFVQARQQLFTLLGSALLCGVDESSRLNKEQVTGNKIVRGLIHIENHATLHQDFKISVQDTSLDPHYGEIWPGQQQPLSRFGSSEGNRNISSYCR